MIGFVYSQVLTEPGQILNPLWKLLDKYLGKYPFIFKPIIDCYKCVSGQMFLWTYLVISYYVGYVNWVELIYGICLTIFIAMILNFINDRIKNT